MIGGCQRMMYYVKDTKSRLFCEAYFVLREGTGTANASENDLASEAERILRERFPKKRRFRQRRPVLVKAGLFAMGLAAGIAFSKLII